MSEISTDRTKEGTWQLTGQVRSLLHSSLTWGPLARCLWSEFWFFPFRMGKVSALSPSTQGLDRTIQVEDSVSGWHI